MVQMNDQTMELVYIIGMIFSLALMSTSDSCYRPYRFMKLTSNQLTSSENH